MRIWTPSTLSRIFYYTSLIRTTIFEFYEERYFGTSLVKITPFHTYYKCKIFSIYSVRKPFLVPRPLIQARQVQTMTWGLRPYSLGPSCVNWGTSCFQEPMVPSCVTGVPAAGLVPSCVTRVPAAPRSLPLSTACLRADFQAGNQKYRMGATGLCCCLVEYFTKAT